MSNNNDVIDEHVTPPHNINKGAFKKAIRDLADVDDMMISLESTLEDDTTIEALESDEIHIELVNYVYDLRKLNHILTILSGETDQDIPEAIKSLPEIEILRQINTAAQWGIEAQIAIIGNLMSDSNDGAFIAEKAKLPLARLITQLTTYQTLYLCTDVEIRAYMQNQGGDTVDEG